MKKILLTTAAFFISTTVWAQPGTMFSLNAGLSTFKSEQGAADSEYNTTHMDLTLGHTQPSGLYLGAIYGSSTIETGSEAKAKHYGVSVGYMSGGWLLHGHYLLAGSFDDYSGSDFEEGSGIQVDVGYLFNMGGAFYLGPQMTYKSMTYEQKNAPNADKLKVNNLYPTIRFSFIW